MDTVLNVVGTVIGEPRKAFTGNGKPVVEFPLEHQFVNDKGDIFSTKFYTTLLNGNADWAEANNLGKGDKVFVQGSQLTATAYKSTTGANAAVLNLKATYVTRVDKDARDYFAAWLFGNVGADADMRYTEGSNARAITNIRLGVNAGYPGANNTWVDKTNWFTVTMFGRGSDEDGNARAERAALIGTGDKVRVTVQSVKGNAYINKAGDLAASVDVIASSIRVVSKKVAAAEGEVREQHNGGMDPGILAAMGVDAAPAAPAVADEDVEF